MPENVRDLTKCVTCGDSKGKLLKCAGCRSVVYCSSNCQSKDWARHKNLCVGFVAIADMGDKGMGLVATKDFEAGERVFREKVAISIDRDIHQSEDFDQEIKRQVDGLSKEERDAYFKLNAHNPDDRSPCSTYANIYMNKTILDDNDTGSFSLTFAMVNHSCIGNCSPPDVSDGKAELRAMRNIKKGDEITMNFLGTPAHLDSTAARRKEVALRFGYKCVCVLCSKGDDKKEEDAKSQIKTLTAKKSRILKQHNIDITDIEAIKSLAFGSNIRDLRAVAKVQDEIVDNVLKLNKLANATLLHLEGRRLASYARSARMGELEHKAIHLLIDAGYGPDSRGPCGLMP